MPYIRNNEGVPIELKTAVRNGEPVEQWDDYWTQADQNKPVMKELLKQRATSHSSTPQGREVVDQAMEVAIQAVMHAGGWDTLQSIPQGRHIEAQLRKEDGELRAALKQLVANAGVLNRGHGRSPAPAGPTPSSGSDDDFFAQIEGDNTDLGNTSTCGHEYKDGSTQTDALPSPTAPEVVDVDAIPEKKYTADEAFKMVDRYNSFDNKLEYLINAKRSSPHRQLVESLLKAMELFKIWSKRQASMDPFKTPVTLNVEGPWVDMTISKLIVQLCPEGTLHTEFIRGFEEGSHQVGWLGDAMISICFHHNATPVAGTFLLNDSIWLLDDADGATARLQHLAGNFSSEQYHDWLQTAPQVRSIPITTELVYFPANLCGIHWIVVTFWMPSNTSGPRIVIYDPIPGGFQASNPHLWKLPLFAHLLGSIPGSPLANTNWLRVMVEMGSCTAQTNGSDCGILAVQNLLTLSNGSVPAPQDGISAFDLRQTFIEQIVTMCQQANGIEDEDQDLINAFEQIKWRDAWHTISEELRSIAIWQWFQVINMANSTCPVDQLPGILRSLLPVARQPNMVKVLRLNIARAPFPDVIRSGSMRVAAFALSPAPPVQLHTSAMRYTLVTRSSRGATFACNDATKLNDNFHQEWLNGVVARDRIDHFHIAISSLLPFLALNDDGSVGSTKQKATSARDDLIAQVDAINTQAANMGMRLPYQFNCIGFDGLSSNTRSFANAIKRWPNLILRLGLYLPDHRERLQPFTWRFANVRNPDLGGCWAFYEFETLAQRAAAQDFEDPASRNNDSANQLVFIMSCIQAYKEQTFTQIGSGNEATYQRTLGQALSGSGSRSLRSQHNIIYKRPRIEPNPKTDPFIMFEFPRTSKKHNL